MSRPCVNSNFLKNRRLGQGPREAARGAGGGSGAGTGEKDDDGAAACTGARS